MEIIGIARLDSLLDQCAKLNLASLEIAGKIDEFVALLKQSHKVDSWIVTSNTDISNLTLATTFEVVTTKSNDPLNEFFNIASNAARLKSSFLKPLVVKIDLTIDTPQRETLDAMIENHQLQKHHYSSNGANGASSASIEIMNFSVLEEAHREALLPDDRNFITPYIYRQRQRFSLGNYPLDKVTRFNA